jgi:prefoldin subunit 5
MTKQQQATHDLIKKIDRLDSRIDKLDSRIDKLDTNIAVMGSILAQLQNEIQKVDINNIEQIKDLEQQIKELKARFWTMFTILVTTTAGFVAWAVQIILSK